jgi:hypothetical protein
MDYVSKELLMSDEISKELLMSDEKITIFQKNF